MSDSFEWRVPPEVEPNAKDYEFDLDAALSAIVGLRARVPADAFTLVLTSRSEQGDRLLQLQLVSDNPDRSTAGVRIRLRHDRADRSINGETDASGRATLPLPRDVNELIVELDPALSLRFRHDN